MIKFYCGKPGNGKTMAAVRDIVWELVNTSRTIVTNVSLKLPEIWEYLEREYPRAFARMTASGVHLGDRVILLEDEQIRSFYTIRNNAGPIFEPLSKEGWRSGKRPDFSNVHDEGVLYVLDEVHISFGSRQWMETGQEVLYYLSQHRKLGDDLICITQAVDNVDRQFRSVAQDFYYFKHLAKSRLHFFRLPNIFLYLVFPCAVPPGSTMKPMETGSFTMDLKGIASLYDTRKGIGIAGKAKADMNRQIRGFSWKWAVLIGMGILWLFYKAPTALLSFMRVKHPATVQPAGEAGGLENSNGRREPGLFALHGLPVFNAENTNRVSPDADAKPQEPVVCHGFCLVGKDMEVFLSDGRVAHSLWGDVQFVRPDEVGVYHSTFPIKPREPEFVEPASPAVGGVVKQNNVIPEDSSGQHWHPKFVPPKIEAE